MARALFTESAKPLVRKGCGGVNLYFVAGYADGEGEGEIGRRKACPRALRPLDEPETPGPRPVAEPDGLDLAFIAQAVEVDVKDGQAAQLMELEERVGGAANRLHPAQPPEESPGEGRLAGTEVAGEVEDRKVSSGGPCERELPAKLFRFLRGVGRDAHAGARG